MDWGWMPLPTRPQQYCDPASLVFLFLSLILSFFLSLFLPSQLKQIFETENFKRASDGNYYQSLTQHAIPWDEARADCKGTESGARLAMLSNEISFQAVLQLIRDDHGWINLID